MPTTLYLHRPPGIVATAVAAALPMAGWAAHATRLRRQLDAAGRDQLTGGPFPPRCGHPEHWTLRVRRKRSPPW
jgi:hypothetical protein